MADSPLLFPSLKIENYRTFRHLTINRLGRVNLIVGKNNVGKSSLLEALWLYSYRGHPTALWNLIEKRDEGYRPAGRYEPRFDNMEDLTDRLRRLKHLFFSRPDVFRTSPKITIGQFQNNNVSPLSLQIKHPGFQSSNEEYKFPTLNVSLGGRPIYTNHRLDYLATPIIELIPTVFVFANGISADQVSNLWDQISLTNLQQVVEDALRLIAPNLEQINLIGDRIISGHQRFPKAKVIGENEPISLQSMGEGMQKLFYIGLALANSEDGLLLIDEIEGGLHYSVLVEMWRIIFETARRLNTQVFATTHSDDCILAFQRAAVEAEETEGMLISLRRKEKNPEEIFAVTSDEEELTAVTELDIEVR